MFRDIEGVVSKSELIIENDGESWSYDEDHPHVDQFDYTVSRREYSDNDEEERVVKLGRVDGYRIAHDRVFAHDLDLWDEADACDGDIENYVSGLIKELRACERVFGIELNLVDAQRITFIRHIEPEPGVDAPSLFRDVTAMIAMKDAPDVMLVDPRKMPEEHKLASGKLAGRVQIPQVLDLGFARMVGSPFLWAWNKEWGERYMMRYLYEKLLQRKEEGKLGDILYNSIRDEYYGDESEE